MNPKLWPRVLFLVLGDGLFFVVANRLELTAISHTQDFYHSIRKEDQPLSKSDPASSDALFRERICQIITDSEFFRVWQFDSITGLKLHSGWQRPKYASIFREIFDTTSSGDFVYANEYKRREFVLANSQCVVVEQVFICPIEEKTWDDVIPLYVSREYNLAAHGQPYKPGRFIFGNLVPQRANKYYGVMVAEEPATAYVQLEFNVEYYYLRQRKHIIPAENNQIDPLCKLISDKKHDPSNQHQRICVAALRSSYFVDRVKYPRKKSYPCELIEVSFQTAEGTSIAAGQRYFERMTYCHSSFRNPGEGESHFYVSRAYKSNHVLLYRRRPEDNKTYLENLNTNVDVIDELNSFDFVEDRR